MCTMFQLTNQCVDMVGLILKRCLTCLEEFMPNENEDEFQGEPESWTDRPEYDENGEPSE